MRKSAPLSLIGKSIRWTFRDGPVKDKTFEHVFAEDGSVTYKMLDAQGKAGKGMREEKSAVEKVDDSVYVVSYLAASGYTLTTLLNFADMSAISFASNDRTWAPSKGTFEIAA